MKHQPRVDPVVTELIGGVRGADNDIAPSIVLALAAVCKSAGKNIGEGVRGGVVELVEEAFMGGRNGMSYLLKWTLNADQQKITIKPLLGLSQV